MKLTKKRKRSRIEGAEFFSTKMSGQSESELENIHSLHVWPTTYNNFSKLPSRVGVPVYSEAYQIGIYKFRIRLYPAGNTGAENWVSIYLEMCEPTKPTLLRVNLFILDLNGIKRVVINQCKTPFEFFSNQNSTTYGRMKPILHSDLMTGVLAMTNDQLIILSEVIDLEKDFINSLHNPCNYGKYLNNALLSDVKIFVKGKTIHAHKILMSGYEVFAAMFEHDMKENRENVINIDDIDFEVMLELIRFIYTGQVYLMERIAKELLIAADKYGIEVLKRKCGKYLSRLLFVDNILQVLDFANQYNVEELEREAMFFFITHRQDVGNSLNFQSTLESISPKLMAKIITSLTNS